MDKNIGGWDGWDLPLVGGEIGAKERAAGAAVLDPGWVVVDDG